MLNYLQPLAPPFSLAEQQRANDETARFSRYESLLNFYEGEQYQERPAPGDRRLIVNYARLFVQKGASYLIGKGYQTEVKPLKKNQSAETRATQIEELLAEVAEENQLDRLDYNTAVSASIFGDGVWKITLQQPDQSLHQPGRPAKNRRIVVKSIDPAEIRASWNNAGELSIVKHDYALTKEQAQALFGKHVGDPTAPPDKLVTITETWTASTYYVEVDKEPAFPIKRNPYGFIPFIHFPNVERPRHHWGDSDLIDLLGIQSEFNTRLSTLGSILHYSGNPVLVLENVDQTETQMRVGAGATWTLPEGSKAYLLELLKSGQVKEHSDYLNLLYQSMHDLSEMPRAAFGTEEFSTISGTALEILLHPVVQKIARKRAIWTHALNKRWLMIQKLAQIGVTHQTRIIWSDPLPRDRQALIANEIALTDAQIHSRVTAAKNLGDEQPEKEVAAAMVELKQIVEMQPATSFGNNKPTRTSGAALEAVSNAG
jgi:hypothetical protein